MRLIRADVLIEKGIIQLEDFTNKIKPPYAILSHRWRNYEVTFQDVPHARRANWPGSAFLKLRGMARQAIDCGLHHVWVDTCCINKESSAELSEAINSMFSWYQRSDMCCVYLNDVVKDDDSKPIEMSAWFSRGWTLQELLAPSNLSFFDREWQYLGDRTDLSLKISHFTGIDIMALRGADLNRYSVAQKMSWAANRETTRMEDAAYCLLGIFNVNMPLLYGEGQKAFYRLQEEIIKDTDDHSIFAWDMESVEFSGLLAPSPHHFAACGQTKPMTTISKSSPFSMTNRGLSIYLKITPWSSDTYLACLECSRSDREALISRPYGLCIFLRRLSQDDQYARVNMNGVCQILDKKGIAAGNTGHVVKLRQVFVRKSINQEAESYWLTPRIYGFLPPTMPHWSDFRATFTNKSPLDASDTLPAILFEGQYGPVMTIHSTTRSRGLKRITLGFDFDFNAVCILEDSFQEDHATAHPPQVGFDWTNLESEEFCWGILHGGERIYREADHKGVWAIRGSRHHGIHAMLSEKSSDQGAVVRLNRTILNGAPVWEFAIDELNGPFCRTSTNSSETESINTSRFSAAFTDDESVDITSNEGSQADLPLSRGSTWKIGDG